jgi:hypothetical protein
VSDYLRFRERFRELIEPYGMYTIEQLDQSLAEGNSQLWAGSNSAMITSLPDYAEKVGQADWVVGDLDEIVRDLIPAAERWFRAQGCKRIMFEGRVGWSRVLKGRGYKAHSVTMVREL